MTALRRYYTVPPVQKGYPLPPYFSVLIPIARTNEILNPSGETNTTGYTAGAGTLTRSTEQQYHGAYSFKYVPSAAVGDGFYYGTISTTAGQTRAIQCKWFGQPGVKYKLSVATTGGVDLVTKSFVATGRWQLVVLYFTETSSTTRRIYFTKDSNASIAAYYIDGVQSEVIQAGETYSTYLDGDQLGAIADQQPPPYAWNGIPHQSTSYRTIQTRSGGMVMRLDTYGLILLAVMGLGLAPVQPVSTPSPYRDGATLQGLLKNARTLRLDGRIDAATPAQLRRQLADLGAAVDRDRNSPDQPLTLLYQDVDAFGVPSGPAARIVASYAAGLEGAYDNHHTATIPLTFTQWLPFIQSDGEAAATLSPQTTVTNANYILQRSAAGTWSALGTGMSGGKVTALAYGPDGKLYAGGVFTLAGGVANTVKIAYWDGTAWNAMGTGATGGDVNAIAVGPDGTVYAGGSFTGMGGVANTSRIAKWNGSAWSALGTGASGNAVVSLAVDRAGNLYAGGTFLLMGGVANTVRIAKWNGSAWSALSTGADGVVNTLVVAPDNTLYLGGDFLMLGGVLGFTRMGTWNGSAFGTLGSGANGEVNVLAFRPDDNALIAGGLFTTVGGTPATDVAIGFANYWLPLQGGTLNGRVGSAVFDNTGMLHLGGGFTSFGTHTLLDRFVRYNGSAYLDEDVDTPGSFVYAIALGPDGSLTIGFDATGSAVPTTIQTVTNIGTARTYPTLVIRGPTTGAARVYQLKSYTTGYGVYFKETATINAGEVWTLVFDPAGLGFTSNMFGDIRPYIAQGSNETTFYLSPGTNNLSFYAGDSTITATLRWRPQYTSISDLTP